MEMLFKKIPAATMIVPMFVSMIFNAIFPDFVNMGGLTTALFSKTAIVPLTGAILFFAGTQLKINEAPEALKRGGVLLLSKFSVGYILGTIYYMLFGDIGLWGVSTLALFAAILSSNGAIYIAISSEYGDDIDIGAYSLLSIKDGPFLTLLALGASGVSDMPLSALFATLFPMILGVVLGNLYVNVQNYYKSASKIIIPFIGISVGASLDLNLVFKAGISGIVLGVVVFIIGAVVLICADKFILKRPGYAGASLACVAGSSVATPTIVAGVVPELQHTVAMASVQLAASVIITAILCPMLITWILKQWGGSPERVKKS